MQADNMTVLAAISELIANAVEAGAQQIEIAYTPGLDYGFTCYTPTLMVESSCTKRHKQAHMWSSMRKEHTEIHTAAVVFAVCTPFCMLAGGLTRGTCQH